MFDIPGVESPVELHAPDIAELRQDSSTVFEDYWLYFGTRVAANGSVGLVNGSTYDLSNGARLHDVTRVHPTFGISAITESHVLMTKAWELGLGVFDLAGGHLSTLPTPKVDGWKSSPLAVQGKFAIVGVPGDFYSPTSPGAAYLFDIETGLELMRFSAGSLGTPASSGGDGFGRAVAIQGNMALIGAPYDSEIVDRGGVAYLFDLRTGELIEKILPHSREYPHTFGMNVGLTTDYAVIEEITYSGSRIVPMTSVYHLVPEPFALELGLLAVVMRITRQRRSRRS